MWSKAATCVGVQGVHSCQCSLCLIYGQCDLPKGKRHHQRWGEATVCAGRPHTAFLWFPEVGVAHFRAPAV